MHIIFTLKWGYTKDLKNSFRRQNLCVFLTEKNKSEIEVEYHALMRCPKYKNKREEIINQLSNVIDIDKCCLTDLFNILWQCKDYDIVNKFTKWSKDIVEIGGKI